MKRTPIQAKEKAGYLQVTEKYKEIWLSLYPVRDTFFQANRAIENMGLRPATLGELVTVISAVREYECCSESHSIIMNALKYGGIWGMTGIRSDDTGFYFKDNPVMDDNKIIMDPKELKAGLRSGDARIRHSASIASYDGSRQVPDTFTCKSLAGRSAGQKLEEFMGDCTYSKIEFEYHHPNQEVSIYLPALISLTVYDQIEAPDSYSYTDDQGIDRTRQEGGRWDEIIKRWLVFDYDSRQGIIGYLNARGKPDTYCATKRHLFGVIKQGNQDNVKSRGQK